MKATMNASGQSANRVPVGEPDWPRDFDFREAYAEQRELLDQAAQCMHATTRAKDSDFHE